MSIFWCIQNRLSLLDGLASKKMMKRLTKNISCLMKKGDTVYLSYEILTVSLEK